MYFDRGLFHGHAKLPWNVEHNNGLALANPVACHSAVAFGTLPYVTQKRVKSVRLGLRYTVGRRGKVHGTNLFQ